MKGFSAWVGSERIQAEAFRIIAKYVHDVYDGTNPDGMSGDETFILGIVCATEQLLDALAPAEEEPKL